MRIAVISDIHGNAVALRKVLKSIEQRHVDKIVCLGDICYGGPEPSECLKLIQSNVSYCVIGNTDSVVIKFHSDPDSFTQVDEEIQWVAENLNPDGMKYLASLPLNLDIPVGDDLFMRLFHGTMSSNKEAFSKDDMTTMAEQETGNVLYAFGHTHQPFILQNGSVSFLNPGSVGLTNIKTKDGNKRSLPYVRYAVVDTENQLSIEFVQMGLNMDMFRDALIRSTIPDKESHMKRWGFR